MDNQAIVKQLLSDIEYATVATVDALGNPWNTPVYVTSDQAYNFYWSSHPDSVHSQNIQTNGKVFIVVYNSKAHEGDGQGVYYEATARVVTDRAEIDTALGLLGTRRGRPFRHAEKFIDDGPQRIYKAVPTRCWLNDADQDADGDFIRDYRREVII